MFTVTLTYFFLIILPLSVFYVPLSCPHNTPVVVVGSFPPLSCPGYLTISIVAFEITNHHTQPPSFTFRINRNNASPFSSPRSPPFKPDVSLRRITPYQPRLFSIPVITSLILFPSPTQSPPPSAHMSSCPPSLIPSIDCQPRWFSVPVVTSSTPNFHTPSSSTLIPSIDRQHVSESQVSLLLCIPQK